MLTMGDAVTVSNLPPGLDAYAGYENGNWQTMGELAARFPGKRLLGISVFLADVGQVLDIERFDATPDQAPAYWKMRRAAGVTRPGFYASISVMPEVVNALSNASITRVEYRLWSAHYQHGEHICGPNTCNYNANVQRVETPQCDGTQWTNNGGSWDESLLADGFFTDRPAPPPPPPPPPTDPLQEAIRMLPAITTNSSDSHRVREVQALLTFQGFPTAIDGGFGPITTDHVLRFQRSRGLAADGVVGPLTWASLVGS